MHSLWITASGTEAGDMNRGNYLRRKLASRRGASITFALLLFLVCTVIGVIVLVAGTAAGGRMSKLAESDARYYAVDSAAQLLRKEIEASRVTVKRTGGASYTMTTTLYQKTLDSGEISNVWVRTYSSATSYECSGVNTIPENILGNGLLPFLEEAAKKYTLGLDDGSSLTDTARWSRDAELTWSYDAETPQYKPLTGGKMDLLDT